MNSWIRWNKGVWYIVMFEMIMMVMYFSIGCKKSKDIRIISKEQEKVIMDMAYIPEGEFMMGCNDRKDNNCPGWEKPYHRVFLDAYYMDKHEVTVAEYARCTEAGVCTKPGISISECGNYPIISTWDQAGNYCKWAGKRLPTEAEWEKAARGTDERIYPWGNERASCKYAVMLDGEGSPSCGVGSFQCGATWPVCSKPDGNSPYGICDMAGNTWQWVWDWYKNFYSISPLKNPKGPISGKYHQVRGGAYNSNPEILLTYRRMGMEPDSVNGFRCVLSVPK